MSSIRARSHDPYDLCTWRPVSACDDCQIAEVLQCRFERQDLVSFLLNFLPFGTAAIAGTIIGGYGWYLLGWLAYAVSFFFIWEARVLCSHCPYWAEEGRILRCHANYGVLKIWQYRPAPTSTSEKAQFIVGALILIAYPFPFMLLGGQYVLALIALSTAFGFGFNLRRHACVRCVNFSCPLNGVPRPVVDAYLRRNPGMREAWEESGYRLSA